MIRLLLFLLFLNLSAVCQTDKSWFKTFDGKIDKYPVTLLLHKAGNGYHGYYYYNSQQKPVYFSGDDTSSDGSVRLLAFVTEDNEQFTFKINGNTAKGTWKKSADSKPLAFTAKAPGEKFTYVYTEGSIKLKPSIEDSPSGEYSAASIWPTGNKPTDIFLKETIRKIFNEKKPGDADIGEMLLEDKKLFFADYLKTNEDATDVDLKQMPSAYNNSLSNQLMICYQSSRILSLAYFNYSYTGGAHGNHGTAYTVIDLKKNKKLSLSDVISEKDRKQLNPLLEKNFRKQYNLKPTDPLTEGGLFENKIEANDNFYVTGKGIGFSYTPYEIGPYVMGEINIFIPFSDLAASRGLTSHPSSFQEHSAADNHLSVVRRGNLQY